MWIWEVPFKKLFLCFFFLFSPLSHGGSGKVLWEDVAVVRFSGRVLFLSELQIQRQALKKFSSCLGKKSLLLKALGLDKDSLPRKKDFQEKSLKRHRKLLEAFVAIEKWRSFVHLPAGSPSPPFNHPLYRSLSVRCAWGPFDRWSDPQKGLWALEVYLRRPSLKPSPEAFLKGLGKKYPHQWLISF